MYLNIAGPQCMLIHLTCLVGLLNLKCDMIICHLLSSFRKLKLATFRILFVYPLNIIIIMYVYIASIYLTKSTGCQLWNCVVNISALFTFSLQLSHFISLETQRQRLEPSAVAAGYFVTSFSNIEQFQSCRIDRRVIKEQLDSSFCHRLDVSFLYQTSRRVVNFLQAALRCLHFLVNLLDATHFVAVKATSILSNKNLQ